jgi:hypothetical protein
MNILRFGTHLCISSQSCNWDGKVPKAKNLNSLTPHTKFHTKIVIYVQVLIQCSVLHELLCKLHIRPIRIQSRMLDN